MAKLATSRDDRLGLLARTGVMQGNSLARLSSSGSYAVLGILGKGGMGRVYLGRMTTGAGFSRLVAIKQIHPHLAEDAEVVGRFLDEARLSSQVRHANVVSTLDVVTSKGRLSLIQEYVEGAALSTMVSNATGQGEPIPIPIAISIAVGILRGLAAAHDATDEQGEALQIVHRDISPQNVLVGIDGVARITDFGVARGAGRLVVTEDGGLRGKLRYMAPEQLRGAPLTRQVDVYAAGVVLWEMLTGARLIAAKDDAAAIAQVLLAELRLPSILRPEVTPDLDAVIARSLSSDIGERYATANEMAAALQLLGPASLDEVAAFVRDVARAELSERQQLARSEAALDEFRPLDEVLAELDRDPNIPKATHARHGKLAMTRRAPLQPRVAAAQPTTEPRRKPLPAEAIALGVLAIVLGVMVFWRTTSSTAPPSTTAAAPIVPPATQAPIATPVPTPLLPALPIATLAPLPSAVAAPAPAVERRTSHPRPQRPLPPLLKERYEDPRDRP